MDEPSMGLAPHVVSDIFNTVREINRQGTTVLLVEQNARKALDVSSFGYVMDYGRIAFGGSASDLMGDPRVRNAYLGIREAVGQVVAV